MIEMMVKILIMVITIMVAMPPKRKTESHTYERMVKVEGIMKPFVGKAGILYLTEYEHNNYGCA